jgi:curved DNA-binding protein CbpA
VAQSDTIPGLGRRSDPVRLAPVDPTRLSLSPEEGFLLSRAQACGSVGELLAACGLPESKAIPLARALKEKGVLLTAAEGAKAPNAGAAAGSTAAAKAPASRYAGFIFNPADLAEDVELPLDLRKEILFLHGHLGDFTHYDFLAVRPKTSTEDIRKAYFDLSRRFHPDRYYGKRLGSYQARLAQVFQRLHDAYDTLSNAERKRAYDAKTDIPLTAEEIAEIEATQNRQVEDARRAEERRARLKRHSRLGRNKGKAQGLVDEAQKAEARGDLKQAASLLQLAATFDPHNGSLASQRDAATESAKSLQLEELMSKVNAAEVMGNSELAEAHLRVAVALDAPDPRAHLALARVILRRGRDPAEALNLAQKATDRARHSAEAFTVLGLAQAAAGDKKAAKAAFQRAVDLDPTADEAKEGLKNLRWSLF